MSTPTTPPRPPAPTPRPQGGGSGLAMLLLTVLVVSTGPVVLLPALIVRAALGRRWPDRLVAALLAAAGALGVTVLLLVSPYVAAWWRIVRWLGAGLWPLTTAAPWAAERPAVGDWLLMVGAALLLGTLYGALRWWAVQQSQEADLYDGKDHRDRRVRAEEKRRRQMTQRVQRFARSSRVPVVRSAAATLAVPLGDKRGPFIGRYQHGPLGGGRLEVHRRPEDRLWRSGQNVRVPLGSGSPIQHLVVLGATGTGKTESTLRLCEWALSRRWQVIYLSAKEPPNRAKDAAAPRLTPLADHLGRSSRVLVPDVSPFDAMRGDLDDVRDRLMAMEEWSEPYYEHAGNLLLALALETGVPVTGLADLVSSLTPTRMRSQAAASGDERLNEIVAALEDRTVAGALMRYASLAVSLRGWVGDTADSASWAWEDADLAVAELPMGTKPKAGRALMRLMVRDLGAYLFDAQRRRTANGDRQPVLLVVEEVGALASDPVVGPEFVNLVERARSAGAVCVLSAQDPLGLGDDRVQSAVLTNAATLTFRQTTQAEAVAQLVGTAEERVDEASKTYDEAGLGTGGSTRRQYVMGLNPQELRRFGLGEAAVIALGRFCTVAAVQPDSGYRAKPHREPVMAAAGQAVATPPATTRTRPTTTQTALPAEPEPVVIEPHDQDGGDDFS